MMGLRQPLSDAMGRRRGFTLIEVLAALVIFAVAIVGLIEGMGTALSFQSDVALRQRAAMLASNVLEEVKYTNDLAEGEDAGQFEGDDATFMWKTAIERTDVDGLMKVTATVSWGQQDNPREYTIATLIYDQGTSGEEQSQGLEESGGQNPTGVERQGSGTMQ